MQQKINSNSIKKHGESIDFNLSQAMKGDDQPQSLAGHRKTIYELDHR
jgi:hypothetical protein